MTSFGKKLPIHVEDLLRQRHVEGEHKWASTEVGKRSLKEHPRES